jgi:hypothetical protein
LRTVECVGTQDRDPKRRPATTPEAPPDEDVTARAPARPTARPAAQPRPKAQARPEARKGARPPGAIPQRARKEKTLTEKVIDTAKRDYRWTAAAVVGGVVLGTLGIYFIGEGHLIMGAISLVLVIPLVFAAIFVKRAPCPACGTPMLVMSIEECDHCHAWIYVENEQLKVVGHGYIAPIATFSIDVPLPVVARLAWPEEKRCVVCSGPAGGNEVLDVQGTRVDIPHCGDHDRGVAWSLSMSPDAVTMVTFRFRAYDYFKLMQEVNAGHLKAGMWRGT